MHTFICSIGCCAARDTINKDKLQADLEDIYINGKGRAREGVRAMSSASTAAHATQTSCDVSEEMCCVA